MGQTQTRKQRILGDVKRARRRRALLSTLIIALIAVGVVVGIIYLTPKGASGSSLDGTLIPPQTYSLLTGVSNYTLVQVGNPQSVTPLTNVGGTALVYGGKNEFLYIGAEYCPYCAAERWGIMVALSKFGTFSGLEYMQSSATDVFPNTPTFSFLQASYQSQYNITFVSVETQDRNRNPTSQSVNSQQQGLLNQYDSGGSIPFIDIGGQWLIQPSSGSPSVYAGAQYSPDVLAPGGSPLNWTQVGSQLNDPHTAIAQAIDGTANSIIKAICQVDGGNPHSLCGLTLAPPTQAPLQNNNRLPPPLTNLISADATQGQFKWRNSP